MRRKDGGYIVVETIGAFMLFTLLLVSILSLINVVTVQTRVHYALTQTANELSMYSYVLDALGLSNTIRGLDETSREVQTQMEGVVSDLNTIQSGFSTAPSSTTELFDNLNAVIDAVGSLSDSAGSALQDPSGTLVDVVRYGLDSAKNWAMQEYIIRPMLEGYLQNGRQDATSFLNSYGVSGGVGSFQLDKSVFIDSAGDITIVASYEIDYTFGALPLPFAKIQVEQTAKTRAWLGGIKSEYDTKAIELTVEIPDNFQYCKMMEALYKSYLVGKRRVIENGKMEYVGNFNDTEYAKYYSKNADGSYVIDISIQGTDAMFDPKNNICGFSDVLSTLTIGSGDTHAGYMIRAATILVNLKIDGKNYKELIKDPNTTFNLTGHSMGGATAQCIAILLIDHGVDPSRISGYTFNSALAVRKNSKYATEEPYISLDWTNIRNSADNVSAGAVPGLQRKGSNIGSSVVLDDGNYIGGVKGLTPDTEHHTLDYFAGVLEKYGSLLNCGESCGYCTGGCNCAEIIQRIKSNE